ncbi:MAG: hypothetical protein IJ677_05740 [Alphaproteobacteria bacterium]|nr:hypothetical protein [Alphaproteobacteria bacterium]
MIKQVINVKKLLLQRNAIIEELKARKIIRTYNNLIGDLAEKLFEKAKGWKLENNSLAGYDAEKCGIKYQIKARMSDKNFGIRKAGIIEYKKLFKMKECRYSKHVKGHNLSLNINKLSCCYEDVTIDISTALLSL